MCTSETTKLGMQRVCVCLTLIFISPRGVISYDPTSLRAMYVKLLMWIRRAYNNQKIKCCKTKPISTAPLTLHATWTLFFDEHLNFSDRSDHFKTPAVLISVIELLCMRVSHIPTVCDQQTVAASLVVVRSSSRVRWTGTRYRILFVVERRVSALKT